MRTVALLQRKFEIFAEIIASKGWSDPLHVAIFSPYSSSLALWSRFGRAEP